MLGPLHKPRSRLPKCRRSTAAASTDSGPSFPPKTYPKSRNSELAAEQGRIHLPKFASTQFILKSTCCPNKHYKNSKTYQNQRKYLFLDLFLLFLNSLIFSLNLFLHFHCFLLFAEATLSFIIVPILFFPILFIIVVKSVYVLVR